MVNEENRKYFKINFKDSSAYVKRIVVGYGLSLVEFNSNAGSRILKKINKNKNNKNGKNLKNKDDFIRCAETQKEQKVCCDVFFFAEFCLTFFDRSKKKMLVKFRKKK